MEEKKNNNLKVIVITAVVTILILFLIINYNTVVKTVYPPDPQIVSSEVNNSPSTLFEYSALVKAVIRNDGGNGDVVFEATVYQGTNHWTKTVKKHFEAKETANMQLQFDEVEAFKGKYQARVMAYSYGK